MITDTPEPNGDDLANRQFAEKRQILTECLHLRMKEERAALEASNAALRALRRAERATKTAAEELGTHTQRQLSL
jgi:hypothetical protein